MEDVYELHSLVNLTIALKLFDEQPIYFTYRAIFRGW